MFLSNATNFKKIGIIAGACILLITLSVAGYRLTTSKSAREAYLLAEYTNFMKYADGLKSTYNDFYQYEKPYIENKYKKRVEISADISSDSEDPFGIEDSKAIFDIIKKCKLLVDYNNDLNGKENLTNMSLLMQKTPLLDALVFNKNNRVGLEIPILLPNRQYIVGREKLDLVYDGFQIPIKPKRLPGPVDIADTLKYNGDKQVDNLINGYAALISGNIEEKDVRFGNETLVKVGDVEKKGREVVVTLDKSKAKKLFSDITKKISTDDELLRLTYENYADFIKLYDEAALFEAIEYVSKNNNVKSSNSIKSIVDTINVKKDLSGFRSYFAEMGDKSDFADGINITVVLDSSNNILQRKMSFSFSKNAKETYLINLNSATNAMKDEGLKNLFLKLNMTNNDEKSIKNEYILTYNAKSTERDSFDINYTNNLNDMLNLAANLKFDLDKETSSEAKNKGLPKQSSMNYEVRLKSNSSTTEDVFSGNIESEATENDKLKTKNINTKFILNFAIPSLNLKDSKIKLTFKKMHKLNSDFTIPEFDTKKMVNFDNLSGIEYATMRLEIFNALADFYLKNKPMMDR